MSSMNHRSDQPRRSQSTAARREAPRLSLSGRWTSAPARPRLVTFSWAAVTPSHSQR